MSNFITIYLTQNCNGNCYFCGYDIPKQYNKENLENLYSILSTFIKYKKISGICITGGEPTLSSNFYLIVEFLNKNNINPYVCTNGTNKITHGNFNRITISRHHYDLNIHNSLTKTNALELKDIINFPKPITFQCVLLKNGIDNITKIKNYIDFYGSYADSITFLDCYPINGNNYSSFTNEIYDYVKSYKNSPCELFIKPQIKYDYSDEILIEILPDGTILK